MSFKDEVLRHEATEGKRNTLNSETGHSRQIPKPEGSCATKTLFKIGLKRDAIEAAKESPNDATRSTIIIIIIGFQMLDSPLFVLTRFS